jgi:hypothetical protein
MAELRKIGSSLMAGAAVLIIVIWLAQVLQPLLPCLWVIFVIGLIIRLLLRHK